MKPPTIFQVDAFVTERPFSGNPAAICLLEEEAPADWMQGLALEMNLAETAYIWPEAAGAYRLRWFTPAVEVPLCGHATLAGAHAMVLVGWARPGESIAFETLSGRLGAAVAADGSIALDFPETPIADGEGDEPWLAMVLDALGCMAAPVGFGRNKRDVLIELASPAKVLSLRPDFRALGEAWKGGVVVTAKGGGAGVDFMSRFFAPSEGIDEDPVTGSAHCTLGPYWTARLGKTEMRAYQASARGGDLMVRLAGGRVAISGRARTVFRATLDAAVLPGD